MPPSCTLAPGENFGRQQDVPNWTPEEALVNVSLGGVYCADVQRVTQGFRPTLVCSMGQQTVGVKNVSIQVAGQTGFRNETARVLEALCGRNFFGRTGELCLPCPVGAYCDGRYADPVALAGWYNLDGVGPDECPPERLLTRPFCDYLVPCEPKLACRANNTCATGYISEAPIFRCAKCNPCDRGPSGTQKCRACVTAAMPRPRPTSRSLWWLLGPPKVRGGAASLEGGMEVHV
jgi:hypothetical protein